MNKVSLTNTYHDISKSYRSCILHIILNTILPLLLIVAGIFIPLGAQGSGDGSVRDSLRNLITDASDSLRVSGMVDLAYEYMNSRPDSMNYWSQQASELALELNNDKDIARTTFCRAMYYSLINKNAKALQHYSQALEGYQRCNHKPGILACYNNIGSLYKKQQEYDKALEYYNKSLDTTITANPGRQADIYNNIGNIYLNKKDFNTALKNYTIAQQSYKKNNDQEGLATIQNNLGMIAQEKGQLQSALSHFQNALKIFSREKDYNSMQAALINLGDTYTLLKRWISATHRYNQALELSHMMENQNMRISLLEKLSIMNANKGEHRKALSYYKQYTRVKDSIFTLEKSVQLASMQAKFENQQKSREIEQLQQHQKLNNVKRNLLLLCLFIVICFTSILFSKQQKKIKNDKELMQKNKQIHQTQKALLAAKLNYKSNELQNFAIHIVQKNEFLKSIKDNLGKIKQYATQENRELLKKVNMQIHQNLQLSKDIELFQNKINRMNEDFFDHLNEKYPTLTDKEKKLCALLKLNLSSKEIASLNNISERAVVMARYRLRKKFQLSPNEKLSEFLNQL